MRLLLRLSPAAADVRLSAVGRAWWARDAHQNGAGRLRPCPARASDVIYPAQLFP